MPVQVVSESFSPNVVASVGWRLFGVKDTSAFPYWFYAPRRKQQEVRCGGGSQNGVVMTDKLSDFATGTHI